MQAFEFADDLGLAHAGVAVNQQARHAVAGGIIEQRIKPIERRLRLIETDPAIGQDPLDALVVGQSRIAPIQRIEMPEFGGPRMTIPPQETT